MTKELPQFLREMLDTPPTAGTGVHSWIFKVSRQLHAHLPAGEIVRLLQDKLANCGRHVPQREIVSAVQNALPVAWTPTGQPSAVQNAAKWPRINTEQQAAILRDGAGLVELWERSPIRIEDNEQHTVEIVKHLFPANSLLCCGKTNSEFDTRTLDDWFFEMPDMALIVPSPMTACTGLTKDGRESAHALANTGPRRFLVVEFDQGATDEHAALLLHLARFAPLVCAVHSGGKSLHGWFFVERSVEEKILKFFRYAVSLGADHATWTRSQFVRMPDGTRENGKRQAVYFLNFKPLEAA
jgi:hypothetical protein